MTKNSLLLILWLSVAAYDASPADEVVLDRALQQDDVCANDEECSLELRQLRVSQEAAEIADGSIAQEDRADWTPATGCSGILCNGNCPITSNPTSDGGCCTSGSIGTGNKHCVRISSSNILKYSCGLTPAEAAGTPSCKNDASFFSNKDKVEKCTLGGQSCTYTKYGWWSRKINLGGGNKLDKLECTCPDVPVYRRQGDDAWALGLVEAEASTDTEAEQPTFNLPGMGGIMDGDDDEEDDGENDADKKPKVSKPVPLPKVNFCCYQGSNVEDVCSSCFGNAFVVKGDKFHNDTHACAVSNSSCMGCGGTWCVPDPNKTIMSS